MWLFTIYGFFSVVCDGEMMAIRARKREHLVKLMARFGVKGHILQLKNRDYSFRMLVSPLTWKCIADELATEITWTNFKAECKKCGVDSEYHTALHNVWFEMRSLQRKATWLPDFMQARLERKATKGGKE